MAKNLGGRPSKYKPEFCIRAVDLMRQGYTKTSVAAELDISKDTLYEWVKEYPEFSDAIARGEIFAQAHLEKLGLMGMNDPKFNARVWEFWMKNRCRDDWNNTQDHNVKVTLTDADVIERANQRVKELQQKKGEGK
ncbi:transposase [Candidatus Odyssella acanthamoebae]|uniref:Uncharacterized protein n=1 Tax=Candidatus Odyssella acanthamoebae TaxID=91604 RepID=A0A077AWC0_9PROT|nr:transposase [Candidatus Paracaedibacter acanthamoebae]AIK95923.1 hypothetical protein ID47_02995 [Candidatus Paracaedibacter acanthamoebae]